MSGNYVATGGKENDVKLWDIESQKTTWTARNVVPDKLGLRVPVWVTSISWLTPNDPHKLVIGTALTNAIRVYDIRSGQRRPAFNKQVSEAKISTVASAPYGKYECLLLPMYNISIAVCILVMSLETFHV